MTRDNEAALTVVGCVVAVAWCLAAGVMMHGCTPADTADGRAEYAGQNEACVRLSTSRAQAEDCIAKSRSIYCGINGLWHDAGVCGDAQ